MLRARSLLGLLLLLAPSCKSKPTPPASRPEAGGSVAAAPTGRERRASPLTDAELPTTSATIALDNLTGQIRSNETLYERDRSRVDAVIALVPLYTSRGQLLGRLADYERAALLAEAAVKAAPQRVEAWLVRAASRATYHRFVAAAEDLAQAERLGARGESLDSLRATILTGQGRLDEALAIRRRLAEARPHLSTLGALANLLSERGQIDEAEAAFTKAQHHFPDVSPFPVAWLYLQQGTMWQREGSLGRARELLEEALVRLPPYAPAISHLAAVEAATGDRERALARLAKLIESSDDPELAGQYAALLLEAGRAAEAAPLIARATTRFGELLKQHPAGFAHHGARFFLGPGKDPPRALALAGEELARRPTLESFLLALDAAGAAARPEDGCRFAEQAEKTLPGGPPRLHVAVSRAFAACGNQARAAEALRRAGAPAPRPGEP